MADHDIRVLDELVGIFLDGADLREVVAQTPGQSVELRVQVSDFVLRRDEGGDPIEVFIGTRDGYLLRLTEFDAVLGARVETRPVLLAAAELQGAAYAVGAGHVGDNRALVVFSDSPAGERMSVRTTDADGQVSDWVADRSTQTLRPHTSPADPRRTKGPDSSASGPSSARVGQRALFPGAGLGSPPDPLDDWHRGGSP